MASVYRRMGEQRFCVCYRDANGKWRMKRTKYRVEKDALSYAVQLEREAENIRNGLIDPKDVELAKHARRPLQQHFKDYLAHLQHTCSSALHLKILRSQLDRMANSINATSLADLLDPNAIDRFLQERTAAGRSAATVNHDRKAVVAFVNWCVARGRVRSNPLKILSKLNVDLDRRRERRALTTDELDALLRTSQERDAALAGRFPPRFPVYLTAALTGLRRNELRTLTWSDVDLERGTIVVRASKGKAKREDVIPLHRQVVDALRSIRPAIPKGRVFGLIPRIRTVYKDIARAGITNPDEEGLWVDLHALRTTLGTGLARSDISVAEVTRLMRHSDYRTTLKHYTRPTLRDDAAAINRLPDVLQTTPPQGVPHSQCGGAHSGRVPGAAKEPVDASETESNPLPVATLGDVVHTPGGGTRASRKAAKSGAISSVG